ncbi:MAG: hypothetical protein QM682_03105 [Paracoccus sp. (in: a-proteobacteria)]|uniref:hypothetical protein n=1 Tax=Paracoccus sp. TaxID=267 RepID=UPI0039E5CDEA
MSVSIHLGAHKTASTHLQLSLRLARDDLRMGGLFLAEPSMLREEAAALPLSDALAGGAGCPAQARCRDLLAQARGDAPHLLLTEENILGGTRRGSLFSRRGLIYPFAVRRAGQAIQICGGGPSTLFLALRDPASFNVSAFALQLSLGNETEFPAFLQGRDPARVGWSGLVKRLTGIEGVARLVIWRFEDYPALRSRLLLRMLPSGLAERVPDPPPSNESMTQAGYDWFLRRATADAGADLRILARKARKRFPRAEGHAPLRLLDEAARARSAAAYAVEIARIERLPKVEFLRP